MSGMTGESLSFLCLSIALAAFAVGAGGSIILRKSDREANVWGHGAAIIGALFGLASSLCVLINGNTWSYGIGTSFPILTISLYVDRLAAFFVFVISLIALFSSIYGLGYSRHYYGKQSLAQLGCFYNIFLGSMILVVCASNSLLFLILWEVMSLASYFLVIFEKDKEENIRAGMIYFIMTHAATAFIILMFLYLYQLTGSLDFNAIRLAGQGITPASLMVLFCLALIGFGTKAGVIPLHIWLPAAHPAAPSHVSALMSGVMIKTGIYMLLRLFFDLLPGHSYWMGVIVLVLGAVSAILGVLYALAEHDIKRLLAYHSIENIGIILLGIGSALLFSSTNMKALAVIGLVAALFHTLNHAVFKALLFLGAGSVIAQTHTRNIEEYGGIIKRMPQTALFFLVGALGISALPPFNGFFSEWLTFQSLFSGIQSFRVFTQGVFLIAAGALALTGGLAAACFVKAFGITFLARPRSERVLHITESALTLRIGMAGLAALTLLLGVLSGPVTALLTRLAVALPPFAALESPLNATMASINLTSGFARISGVYLTVMMLIIFLVLYWAVRIATRNNGSRKGATWDCGALERTGRMEITATGFSRSLITIFQGVLKPSIQSEMEYSDARSRYFPKFSEVVLHRKLIFSDYLYDPLNALVLKLSEKAKKIQSGNTNWYVLYIFLALLILLLLVCR